jgi:hypothetical protein
MADEPTFRQAPGGGLESLRETVKGLGRLPPVERWNPAYCGDSDIKIARDGSWSHQGEPIRRPELVRLFSTILRKDDEGFMLVTPAEKLSIAVEDAPFLAVLMAQEGEGESQRLTFTTNVGDEVIAGVDHPLRFAPDSRSGAPIPYLHVRGGLEAKLARAVYYPLVELAVQKHDMLGVWSGGAFFVLGAIP